MYLDVEFDNGQVTHIPLSRSHTVRVVTPTDDTQDAFSLDGVKSVTLNLDGAPQATDPNPPANVGAAEGATPDPTVEASGSGGSVSETPVTSAEPTSTDSTNASGASSSDAAPADPPAADPVADTPADTPPADDAHDVAVADIQQTVSVATDPGSPADAKALALAQAENDVNAALAMWPDSTVLADLKTQLDTLNG